MSVRSTAHAQAARGFTTSRVAAALVAVDREKQRREEKLAKSGKGGGGKDGDKGDERGSKRGDERGNKKKESAKAGAGAGGAAVDAKTKEIMFKLQLAQRREQQQRGAESGFLSFLQVVGPDGSKPAPGVRLCLADCALPFSPHDLPVCRCSLHSNRVPGCGYRRRMARLPLSASGTIMLPFSTAWP